MAKILISLLGTGNKTKGDDSKNTYETTSYKIADQLYKNRSFVSSAIADHYQIDQIFTIGTKESMWDNLCGYYADEEYALEILEKKEQKSLQESDLIRLSSGIDDRLKSSGSKCFIVDHSESKEELEQMLNKLLTILDGVSDQDELYFDITHLFRSVSVLMVIIAEFANITRGIKIAGMFYGVLKKNEPSSVVDLSVYLEFLAQARASK